MPKKTIKRAGALYKAVKQHLVLSSRPFDELQDISVEEGSVIMFLKEGRYVGGNRLQNYILYRNKVLETRLTNYEFRKIYKLVGQHRKMTRKNQKKWRK